LIFNWYAPNRQAFSYQSYPQLFNFGPNEFLMRLVRVFPRIFLSAVQHFFFPPVCPQGWKIFTTRDFSCPATDNPLKDVSQE
jgi:hypothetical protein